MHCCTVLESEKVSGLTSNWNRSVFLTLIFYRIWVSLIFQPTSYNLNPPTVSPHRGIRVWYNVSVPLLCPVPSAAILSSKLAKNFKILQIQCKIFQGKERKILNANQWCLLKYRRCSWLWWSQLDWITTDLKSLLEWESWWRLYFFKDIYKNETQIRYSHIQDVKTGFSYLEIYLNHESIESLLLHYISILFNRRRAQNVILKIS